MANFFQPVVDATRVFLNSAMGGLPEMSLTEAGRANAERNRAENAAARERLGITGDALNVAGYFAPGLGALKGIAKLPTLARAVPGAVKAAGRAIPAAERAIASKIVPGYAARASALSRLDLPAMGTVSGAIGNAVAKRPVLTLGAPAAFGVGTAASHNIRTYDAENAARPARPVQQQVKPQQRTEAPARPTAAQPAAAAETNPYGGSTFDQLIERVAASQGGQISLAQMGALAEMVDHTTPRGSTRQPRPQDLGNADLNAYVDAQRDNTLKAGGDPKATWEEWYARKREINKIAPQFYPEFDEGQ